MQARALSEAEKALLEAAATPKGAANGTGGPHSAPPAPCEHLRGPALARVDIAVHRLRLGLPDERSGRDLAAHVARSIATYFASFGDSASCAVDLRHAVSDPYTTIFYIIYTCRS